MGLSEKANKNKIDYINEYAKTHYKRIPLNVKPEEYERIKAAASASRESINGYIKKAIYMRLKGENINIDL